MDFVELPEHLNCSFAGTYSPVFFRVEASNAEGGVLVEERLDKPPHVTINGDAAAGKRMFRHAICEMNNNLNDLVRYELLRSDDINEFSGETVSIMLRRSNRRFSLFATGNSVRLEVQGEWDRDQMNDDLEDSHTRLIALYERFYDTEI